MNILDRISTVGSKINMSAPWSSSQQQPQRSVLSDDLEADAQGHWWSQVTPQQSQQQAQQATQQQQQQATEQQEQKQASQQQVRWWTWRRRVCM